MSQEGYSLLVSDHPVDESDYFFDHHARYQAKYFSYKWVKRGKTRALLSLHISENGIANSLPQAPFGGIKTFGETYSDSIAQFIKEVMADLEQKDVRKISITQRPKPYERNTDLIQYLLHREGFRMENLVNHQFFIGKKKIKTWLKEEGALYEKKRRAQRIDVSVGPIRNFDFLSKISEWNSLRGYHENLDLNSIIQQVSVFPDRYFELVLRQEGQLVAAALAVSLTSDSIYYFKSGIDPKINLKQVGDILLRQLFSLAVDLKVNFIDLGSSDLESEANHQLFFFKSRFSNDQFNKVNWSKTI